MMAADVARFAAVGRAPPVLTGAFATVGDRPLASVRVPLAAGTIGTIQFAGNVRLPLPAPLYGV